jgi:hypothetical protein
MAMNKARRTANLNNILTYDTLGNSTLIANLTVEGLTGAGFVKADANGLLSVDTAAYTVVTGATNYLTKITAPNTLGQSLVYDNGTSIFVNSATGVPGYAHAFQVVSNAGGGLIVSTTNSASAIGIVNSASGGKAWDISPFNNTLSINESNVGASMVFHPGGNITVGDISTTGHRFEVIGSFRTTGNNTFSQLQGVGTRMVVADTNGLLSTQVIDINAILPSQAGNAGKFFKTNGTTSLWSNILVSDVAGAVSGLTGEVSTSGTGVLSVTLSNLGVTSKVLTGLSVAAGSLIQTDSILTAFGKLQGQINALSGGSTYRGTWNASTNTPTITSSVGTAGDYYIVSVSGTTNINGINAWDIGDWIIFDGSVWQKVDNTDSVTSVNGLTGSVNLTTSNITEATNLYYTDARARAAISLTTTGSSGAATYSSGVLNIPNYTISGLGGVSGTGVTGQVSYWSGTSAQSGSNNLFWEASTNRLGIGTNLPSTTLHVVGNGYIDGRLGVGTSALPAHLIHATGNISGRATSYGILQSGSVQNSVTTLGVGYENQAIIADGVASNAYHHFRAVQNTFGAGTSLQFQAGFFVTSTLTSATNNYGFYGNMPAAANSWNLYMAGAGNNYMFGNLLLGNSTDTTEKLQVTGAAKITGVLTVTNQITAGNAQATTGSLVLRSTYSSGNMSNIGTNGSSGGISINYGAYPASISTADAYLSGIGFQSNARSSYAVEADHRWLSAVSALVAEGSAVTLTEKMRLYNSGNLVIQNGGTFTDSGEKLQVGGTIRVTNSAIPTTGAGLEIGYLTGTSTGFITSTNRGTSLYTTLTINGLTLNLNTGSNGTVNFGTGNIVSTSGKLRLGTTSGTTGYINIGINSASGSQFNLATSAFTPTSPVNGDGWFDGTSINFRVAGVTTKLVTGSGTANYVSKWSSSSGLADSQIYDNGTNIGIGDATPSVLIDAYKASNGIIRVRADNGGAFYVANSTKTGTIAAIGDSGGIIGGSADTTAMVFAGSVPLAFYVNSNERARITTSGDFGIGILPSHKLDVNGNIGIGGKIFLGKSSFNNIIYDDIGLGSILIGNDTWTNTYYRQGTHHFQSRTAGDYLIIGSTLIDVKSNLTIASGNNLTWGGVYGAGIPTIAGVSGTGALLGFYPAGTTSGLKMTLQDTGQLKLHSYTSTSSFSGTTVGYLGFTSSGELTTNAISGSQVTGAALTGSNDTNVTISVGGNPSNALLRSASLTMGWSGQLSASRGGTGTSGLTGIIYGNGASAMTAISGVGGQILRIAPITSAYEFWTPTYLDNVMTSLGDIIYSNSVGAPVRLASNPVGTNRFLMSVSSGAPSWQQITVSDVSGAISGSGSINYLPKWTSVGALGNSLVYDNGTSVIVNKTTAIGGYSHSFQVEANAGGAMIVSATNISSAIGIVNTSSGNKTWDISPFNDDLAINESGVTTRMRFRAAGNIEIPILSGTGTRMVVADTNGVLSTQAVPSGTVTSVNASVPTGFTVGAPVTSSGNISIGYAAGYSLPTTASQTNWDASYNDKINSAAVTGTTTKTLTLNQQDGGSITATWTDIDTAPVSSIFGRTGAVVAASGDYNTAQVTESGNLYYTDARARAAISLTTSGSSGASTYISGVLNVPNYTLSGLGGVPTSTTLTINGVGYDLSTSRSWTVAGMAIGGTVTSATAGSILFAGASGVLAQNNANLFWDNGSSRLGIGDNAPADAISVLGNTSGLYVRVRNQSASTGANSGINLLNNASKTGGLYLYSSNYTTSGVIGANTLSLFSGPDTNISVAVNSSGYFSIGTGSTTPDEKLRLFNNGNLLLQNGGTFSDNGQRLQVIGKSLIIDDSTYAGSTVQSFVVQKNLTINSAISGSTGICNYVSTGDNFISSSQSVPESTSFSNIFAFNKYGFNSAGLTLTATQASPGVRAVSQISTQNIFKGVNAGTVTHMAGIHIGGYRNESTGTITPTIQNAYQLLINDTGAYAHTFNFGERWGIYQEGINDRNYFAGNMLLNDTSDTGQILQVTGAIRVNGQRTTTSGAASGQFLSINCDGTTYKIQLLNP